ncbi:hypothetical protein [Streptosporangium soli]
MRIAVSGHMNLTPGTVSLVHDALRTLLAPYAENGLVGVSCIAAGADQIFAQVVLDLGGRLEVIIPSADYRDRKVKPDNLTAFDHLVERAAKVRYMPFPEASRDAYEAANSALFDAAERLVTVWDGKPSGGRGGTADVVTHAKSLRLPVDIIWPNGAERS